MVICAGNIGVDSSGRRNTMRVVDRLEGFVGGERCRWGRYRFLTPTERRAVVVRLGEGARLWDVVAELGSRIRRRVGFGMRRC